MLTVDGIEKVVRSEPFSAAGSYREVWFIGDVVVKQDANSGKTNRSEVRNYEKFKPQEGVYSREAPQPTAWYDGAPKVRLGPINYRSYNIRFPEMFMVGDYLVAERVKFPHPCAEHREEFGYRCGDTDTCVECRAAVDVEYIMRHEFGVMDMHAANFCYDAETNTAYIVDIQDL